MKSISTRTTTQIVMPPKRKNTPEDVERKVGNAFQRMAKQTIGFAKVAPKMCEQGSNIRGVREESVEKLKTSIHEKGFDEVSRGCVHVCQTISECAFVCGCVVNDFLICVCAFVCGCVVNDFLIVNEQWRNTKIFTTYIVLTGKGS